MELLKRLRPDVDTTYSPLTAGDYEAMTASIKVELDAEPPIVVAPLPPYDHDAPCPKCRFAAGTTKYFDGYHGDSCSVPERPMTPYFGLSLGLTRSEIEAGERFRRQADALPEHFERKCPNCAHEWAEAAPVTGK